MQLNQSDIENHKALEYIILNSKMELKGDAVVKVASLLSWYKEFGLKLQESAKPKHEFKEENIQKNKGKKNGKHAA